MHQSTLNGIPQPASAPRNRGGRPKLPDDKKPIGRKELNVYREDEEAFRVLRKAGYRGTEGAILRRLAREKAAEIAQRGLDTGGRLEL